MTDDTPRHQRMELADETIADLATQGDVAGGMRPLFSNPCVQTDDDVTCGPYGNCVIEPPKCED